MIGIFSDSTFPLAQRVLCVAYVPHRIIPLEPDTMRIHLIPDLPHALAATSHTEAMRRGLVVVAGACKPFRLLTNHTVVKMTISDAREGEGSHLMDKELWWDGTSAVIDFDFDPEDWLTEGDVSATHDDKGPAAFCT